MQLFNKINLISSFSYLFISKNIFLSFSIYFYHTRAASPNGSPISFI